MKAMKQILLKDIFQLHFAGDDLYKPKAFYQSKKISNDQELIQSDPTSCPQNQKGNN